MRKACGFWCGIPTLLIVGQMESTGGANVWTVNEDVACCLDGATCQVLQHNDCVDQGGEPYPPGIACEAITCVDLAWVQAPRMVAEKPLTDCVDGWAETSIRLGSQIAADDFVLPATAPIAEIRWWGGYRDWLDSVPPPDAAGFFHLAIWTHADAETDPPDIAHPDTVVHAWFVPRSVLSETYTTCVLDPSLSMEGASGFYYRWSIPPEVRFTAQGGVRYWLTISVTLLDPDCACDSDVAPPFGTYNQADVDFVNEQIGCEVGVGDPDCDAADLNCDGVVDDQDAFIAHCQRISTFPDPWCCLPVAPKSHWGWITREEVGEHVAVRINSPTEPIVGSTYGVGALLQNADGVRQELAFVIVTGEWPSNPGIPTSPPQRQSCIPDQSLDEPSGLPARELIHPNCQPQLE
jgi:hypothetical protein